jgi:hypothetical protein
MPNSVAALMAWDAYPGPPWILHILVVFLSAFILGRLIRPVWISAVLSVGIGILTCLLLSHDFHKNAEFYWYYRDVLLCSNRSIPNGIEPWKREVNPDLLVLYCWIVPSIMASVTSWLRSRRQANATE